MPKYLFFAHGWTAIAIKDIPIITCKEPHVDPISAHLLAFTWCGNIAIFAYEAGLFLAHLWAPILALGIAIITFFNGCLHAISASWFAGIFTRSTLRAVVACFYPAEVATSVTTEEVSIIAWFEVLSNSVAAILRTNICWIRGAASTGPGLFNRARRGAAISIQLVSVITLVDCPIV